MGLALAHSLGLPTRYEVPFGLALAALVASHVRYGIIVLYWTMFSSAALCVVTSSWPAVALPPTLLLDGIALVVGAGVTVWSEVHLDRNDKRIDNAVAIPLATALIVMSLDACVGLFSWAVQCIAGFCLGAVFLSHMLLEWEDRKRHATTACSSTAQVSTKADQTNETERADTTDVADERPKAD
ncbi:hypothetical protein SDRG_14320 [Saprolegnia diclina VS20]|uniref:Uncharacterized protein n=1 Tax=Saprolegnia diclina (strain VS20) TaxID=1156394 RepID=T0PQX2_SAPDV|nr:hypothetical protein SDRG_14320 [Saprolegnia diclina VS20]EQC27899.1 hypothetical protein SDRG_14320 [Saprolegnia diclina VS20]|eukprot:XP_008618664.1 hypothetical protein SDRG_14320 [Saprolegnia diclina VS20]